MTTNGVLLDRYIDFIAQHNFLLLLSLDGDKEGNGYRVFHSGESSFDKVYSNIKLLKEKYPEYFEEHVNFNTVLHNKNNVKDIHEFFKSHFSKFPTISPLNNSGIRVDKQELFQRTYRNFQENLKESENYEKISEDLFTKDPTVNELTYFLHRFTNNVYKNYTALLRDRKNIRYLPTGTCTPFGRKLFLTVNGKIFPCERIGQLFPLGHADEGKVDIDFERITTFYNSVYDKLQSQCERCFNKYTCLQCIFHLADMQGNPQCHGFMNDGMYNRYMEHNMTHLENHPETYPRIMKEVIFY